MDEISEQFAVPSCAERISLVFNINRRTLFIEYFSIFLSWHHHKRVKLCWHSAWYCIRYLTWKSWNQRIQIGEHSEIVSFLSFSFFCANRLRPVHNHFWSHWYLFWILGILGFPWIPTFLLMVTHLCTNHDYGHLTTLIGWELSLWNPFLLLPSF